jgi:hypothetical protein
MRAKLPRQLKPRIRLWLIDIGLPPVADSDNIHDTLSIIDAVNNAVVSDTNTPQVFFAL